MSIPTWELFDTQLVDRVLLPTGSHNPDTETGEDCMTVADHNTALEIVNNTNLQVIIVAPWDATTPDDFDILESKKSIPLTPLN